MSILRLTSRSFSVASILSQDCTLCGVQSRASLCKDCHHDLPFRLAPSCPRCNAPGVTSDVCGACLSAPPHFDETTSAFRYVYPLDRLVQAYKFNANLGLLPLFSDALIRAIRANNMHIPPDLVIPLPLASRRLAERGFNQSALLGAHVSKALGLRYETRGMLRVRETPPQAGLNRVARLKNVRGAFDCVHSLHGRHVAVIDDVMTTGATLSEAARVLKKAGAARVSAWVIARAEKDEGGIVTVGAGLETVPFDAQN